MSASIVERKRRDGTPSFTAQIKIHENREVIHSESETFETRAKAEAWRDARLKALAKPGAVDNLKVSDPPLSEAIDKYLGSLRKETGKTKQQVLRAIKSHAIGKMRCSRIGSQELLEFANHLAQDRQAQTVGNYMSHLSTVFRLAKPAWGYPLDYKQILDAIAVAKHQGTIERSTQRDRRPTLDELSRLLEHFAERERRDPRVIPMTIVTMFGIYSTRRQEEITRITIKDLDEKNSEIIVRDLKHPGEKIGNDVRTLLPPEALQIIRLQMAKPKVQRTGLLFPYNSGSISRAFTDSCTLLGIEDLHFHDLRHDGISRLFEMAWPIPNVAMVSAHRTWTSLKRYTHIRHSGDKYAGWHWLEKLGIVTKTAES